MNKKLIYVLEDEENIRHLIRYNLESSGFRVRCFETGSSLFSALEDAVCDLLLLDIMLPDTDGYEVLAKIRLDKRFCNMPVIMLTAKKEELDKILGLEMGSDDYITKPFSVREMTSRIKAVLRRASNNKVAADPVLPERIELMGIEILPVSHQVRKDGKRLPLSLKEYQLLEILMSAPGKVFTRDMLLDKIWGYEYIGETRTVDVHIRYLRRHLGDNGPDFKYIDTIRGLGYKFIDSPEASDV
ncbi:MAG: response regulator transcription factor [Clostridia bacterium]|nr:response regulator transcription factor [Clostridia bacterium]